MLSAAIIGAGTIAFGHNEVQMPMTHLGTYEALNDRVQLLAFAEPDSARRQFIEHLFPKIKAYESVACLLESEHIDIVSLCTPDHLHEPILHDIMDYPVRGVWCEKPLTTTGQDAKDLIQKIVNTRIAVQVNYWRRFIPEIADLKKRLMGNEFGKIHSVTGYYADSYIHNGSHLIDLIHFLVGKLYPRYAAAEEAFDTCHDRPVTIFGKIDQAIPCVLQPIPREPYNLFELNLFTGRGRIRIGENGRRIELFNDKRDDAFPHLRILRTSPETIKCQWRLAFKRALANLIDCLTFQKDELICGAREAGDCVEALTHVSGLL
jgi:predicted dehydrogenase